MYNVHVYTLITLSYKKIGGDMAVTFIWIEEERELTDPTRISGPRFSIIKRSIFERFSKLNPINDLLVMLSHIKP